MTLCLPFDWIQFNKFIQSASWLSYTCRLFDTSSFWTPICMPLSAH